MQDFVFEKIKKQKSIIINDIELEQDDDVAEAIIRERNKEIQELEQDLSDLSESMEIIASLLQEQGEELDIAENNTENSVIAVEEAAITISKLPTKKEKLIRGLKIAGTATVSGIVLGGIGFLTYGIGTAIIATSVGVGGGAGIGYIINLFKK